MICSFTCFVAAHAETGGWCYRPGAYEAWMLKRTVGESKAALCHVGWPGRFEYPSQEPVAFWRTQPVDGYDFIPGPSNVPPHRAARPVREVTPTQANGLFDLGREELGFVVCAAKGTRPNLFVGESAEEASNEDANAFEQVTRMDSPAPGVWRSRYPLALRYFRFDRPVEKVKFLSEIDRRTPAKVFHSSNPRAEKIWWASVETLRPNLRTFLLDGPKRDRLPWMGDFVIECLADAASFDDPEPAKRSLVAVGTPPRLGHINGIGAFSLWWVVGQDVLQQKFPDTRFLALHYPRIRERVEAFQNHVDARGFYAKNLGWNFMDWTDSRGGQLKSEITLQVIYFAALKSAARLASRMDDRVSETKWNARADALKQKLLAVGLDGTRQARALALVFDLAEGDMAKRWARELAADDLSPTVTPYMATMEVWALAKTGERAAAQRKFESVWGRMIDRGVTTFWEAFDERQTGEDRYVFYSRPFGKSLCHAWSAGPAFLLPLYPWLADAGDERRETGVESGRETKDESSAGLKRQLLKHVTVFGSADIRSANITRGSIVNPEPIQSFTGGIEFTGGDRAAWYGEDGLGARVWTCNHLTAARDHQMPRAFNETDPYLYFRNRTFLADGWSVKTESGFCWVLYQKFKNSDAPLSETEWRLRQEFETPWVTPYWYGRYTFKPYDLVYWQTGLKRTFAPLEDLTVMPFGFLDWGDDRLFNFKYGLSQGAFHGGVSAIDVGLRGHYAITDWFGVWAQFDAYWIINAQARQANRTRGGVTSRNEICVFSAGIEFRF